MAEAPLPLPRLELTCFGPPRARLDGKEPPAEVTWRRHMALLVYLALSPDGTRTRDHLVGLLWPEKPEDKARHALNESLRRLRHALGPDRLQSHGNAITLSPADLAVDALDFNALAQRDPAKAAALVRGDFLEGFLLDEAPAFDDWVGIERQRCRSRAAAALISHGETLLASCRYAEASDLARRAFALEPYAEPAARLLIRAAALGGDTGSALAAYHEFAERLSAGIHEQPSRELTALAERVRRQVTRPAAAGTPVAEPPLVGRERLHREAFELLRTAVADGPRTMFVTGAPGMGRTRLAAECIRRLALDGAVIAFARPLASDHDAPWSTLRLLMRSGLDTAPGLIGADADALGVLAGLVPELAERTPARPARDAAHVAAALASALGAIAAETPLALVIDDAHLSDGASLEVLAAALAGLRAVPILLLITSVEGADAAPRALLQLRGDVGRALRGASLRLDALSAPEVRELVAHLSSWCAGDEERDRLARRLIVEAGGNLFFLVTLLEGLERLATFRADFVTWPRRDETFASPLPFSIPDLARVAILARVTELDHESRWVLSVASVAGSVLDVDLLSAVIGEPREQVESQLAAAERHHLIVFDGQRYAFAAAIIADAIRGECLTPGQRRQLRQRAAVALSPRPEMEARVLRAELLAALGPSPEAFAEAVAVAHHALAAGSNRTARRALAVAERSADAAGPSSGAELASLRTQLRASSGA